MKIFITTPCLIPHGGIRVILEWADRLAGRGHNVILYCSRTQDSSKWFPFKNRVQLVNTIQHLQCCDLLIVSSPHDVELLSASSPKKKVVFIQMLEHTFYPEDKKWAERCGKFYFSADPMISISQWNMKWLQEHGRTASTYYVGNGVNFQQFPLYRGVKEEKTVLVEGWVAGNPTKDVDQLGPKVAKRLKAEGYKIISYGLLPLTGEHKDVPDEYYCRPTLAVLNKVYERAAIMIKASRFDARSCAPVEAMAKGTPTARAIIMGDDDLIHDVNCLRCSYEEETLYSISKQLLTDSSLRNRLIQAGYDHVSKYNWDYWMDRVLAVFEEI